MAEALVVARAELGSDDGSSGGAWKWALGHVVAVQEDGWPWNDLEDPRNFQQASQRRFALLRFPGISVTRIQRYLAAQVTVDQFTGILTAVIRSRLWQIQWTDLPQAAKNILIATGVLTIGPASIGGDFTWAQVQNFVKRLDNNTTDTDPLT
jgi:hypothetical protein